MANPFFNADYYLAQNPDLATNGVNAANAEWHYDTYGAGEGRAPNPWFDATAYLLADTDLIANGVTLATALAHFAAYGVNEGRQFNNNPALQPSNFSAKAYASANADVAAALGITDLNAITPLQHNELMAHYLAYGAAEGRQGVDASFAEAVAVAPITVLTAPDPSGDTQAAKDGITVGTAGNDIFVWGSDSTAIAAGDKVIINGLDGVDTLKLVSTGATVSEALKLVSVENISAALAGTTTITIANGADVESISIANATGSAGPYFFTANFDAGVSGTNDALAVSMKDTAAFFTNGIEVINATLGEADGAFFGLYSNSVSGTDISFNLAGGKAGNGAQVGVESVGSGALKTADIDASSFAGNLKIYAGLSLLNVQNINITTGAGNDTITTAGGTATVNAGAGNDIILAHAGVDILTGGAGADTFNFTRATALVKMDSKGENIAAFDIIHDFSNAKDTTIGAVEQVKFTDLKVGSFDNDVGKVDANGVLTFATGFATSKSLTEIVAAFNTGAITTDQGVLFNYDGNAYLFVTGPNDTILTDDCLIQFTGVNASDLAITAGSVAFA